MADDLGYGDLGVYGGKISTPNIKALAKAGVRFTDFHTNASCSPTRAAIMTGRYAEHSKIIRALPVNATTGLPPAEVTIAEALKPAGYATGLVGKWHLGHLDKFSPLGQGFEYFFGFLTGSIDYVNHLDASGHLDWWRMKTALPNQEYSTTAITNGDRFYTKKCVQALFPRSRLSGGAQTLSGARRPGNSRTKSTEGSVRR
ncbi:MAG: sulfatase-like hydrolase/transferase [Rhodospirillales bacterium]|nr:sulfatase-like hydrolase/transferase [Rhodospirillales bacterium]